MAGDADFDARIRDPAIRLLPQEPGDRSALRRRVACALAAAWLTGARALAATDPLDPLSAAEIRAAATIVRAERGLGERAIFPLLELHEPDKAAVLDGRAAKGPRRAFAIVREKRRTYEAVVDLAGERVESWRELEGVEPRLTADETRAAGRAVRESEAWRSGLAARGIALRDVACVTFSAGVLGRDDERGVRLGRVLTYDRRFGENFWAHPVEGLVATVDLDREVVVRVDDSGPVAAGAAPAGPAPRPTPYAAPPPASEPDPAVALDGHRVAWGPWTFHVRLDARAGLVLSRVHLRDGEERRSVLYQGSLSELFVPYMDPALAWRFRSFLDAGELGIGAHASRLDPERQCPARARYMDAVLAGPTGDVVRRERAICLFERAPGDPLWTHSGAAARSRAPRLGRELVVRSVATLGNYDYVFDWIFREEGTIRVAVGATGIALAKAVAAKDVRAPGGEAAAAHGRFVDDHTVAVNHDHFMSFRLDLDVDGPENDLLVDEIRAETTADSSLWTVRTRRAEREREAMLHMSMERPALWRVASRGSSRVGGSPTSYQLHPEHNAMSLFAADPILDGRAGFTRHTLWATPWTRGERHAAGEHPNQATGGGLPAWTAADRPLAGADLVLWYTLGFHHVVRAEDWPIMPTSWHAFELRPFDFFPQNPALGN